MVNFADLPTLISDSWRKKRDARARDRERLLDLKAKRIKHKPSKAHSTNRERSYAAREKASRIDHIIRNQARTRKDYTDAVRAYWNGERDTHPEKPEAWR